MNRPKSRPRRRPALPLLALGVVVLLFAAWRDERVPILVERAGHLERPVGLRWFTDAGWSATPPLPLAADQVLLVHGLDEPGGIWDQLAPAVSETGRAVVRFDYPNDQPIADSADALVTALGDLRALGVTRLEIVAHSMGGLVARDTLTRPHPGEPAPPCPDVPLLITLGTPHQGSDWARYQAIAEAREQAQRYLESNDRNWLRLFAASYDGHGEAARDLQPRSAFLRDLNARPWPPSTRVVCVVGVWGGETPDTADHIADPARRFGDGVVPADSAVMPGADRVVFLSANHRTMVRSVEIADWFRRQLGMQPPPTPPAIPVVLDELARDQADAQTGKQGAPQTDSTNAD